MSFGVDLDELSALIKLDAQALEALLEIKIGGLLDQPSPYRLSVIAADRVTAQKHCHRSRGSLTQAFVKRFAELAFANTG